MFIHLIWILTSLAMASSHVLRHEYMETVIWSVGWFYGVINYIEYKLRGSKYDY